MTERNIPLQTHSMYLLQYSIPTVFSFQLSVRTDNRYVSVLADISVIGQYIGFADIENAYRYRLSVSADMNAHIGVLTDIL